MYTYVYIKSKLEEHYQSGINGYCLEAEVQDTLSFYFTLIFNLFDNEHVLILKSEKETFFKMFKEYVK